jgi:hypothetical protein
MNAIVRMEEELMMKANTKPPATLPVVDLDSAIARYETMPLEHVERELHDAGIDPRPTVAAVKALVAKTLRHKRERRSVHGTEAAGTRHPAPEPLRFFFQPHGKSRPAPGMYQSPKEDF